MQRQQSKSMTCACSAPDTIFRTTHDNFVKSLGDDEKAIVAKCTSASTLLKTVRAKLEGDFIEDRWMRICKRIKTVSENLKPFFDTVNIFVQTNSEYSALVWGTLRLIFLLGSNYASFLGKAIRMLEDLSRSLPAYELYINAIGHCNARNKATHHCLLEALGYVYADIVQFCHDIIRLFTPRKNGILYKARFVSKLLFRPFETQFADLLERLSAHERLLRLYMTVNTEVEALEFYNRFEKWWADADSGSQAQYPNVPDASAEAERLEESLFNELRMWLCAPNWMDPLVQACSHRLDNTGSWLFKLPEYQTWLQNTSNRADNYASRFLFIRGKPGYGKTVLCSGMIQALHGRDDVDDKSDDDMSPTSPHCSPSEAFDLSFYFFDKYRKDTISSGSCLRALLDQLASTPDRRRYALDLYSLIRNEKHTKPLKSSDEDVAGMLRLMLQVGGQCLLVIDGLDECDQPDAHLIALMKLAESSLQTRIAIFSRPSLLLPRSLDSKSLILDLKSTHNSNDITSFLRPQIRDLLEVYKFLDPNEVAEVVKNMLLRAEGMFLWARLLMSYLRSPSLTNRDRQDAIENLRRLEGLDSLFSAILDNLAKSLSGKAKENVKKLFEWVTVAARPLKSEELAAAVGIPLDRASTLHDNIPQLKHFIGVMSGALLEIGTNGTVRFAHLSVRDFLTSTRSGPSPAKSEFEISPVQVHLRVAHACLSYLHHTVPSEPLSGSSQVIPDPDHQRKRFPVLEYAVQFWPNHVSKFCMSFLETKLEMNEPQLQDFSRMFVDAIRNKAMMSLWIEAAWMFGTSPSFGTLPKLLASTSKNNPLPKSSKDVFFAASQYLEDFEAELALLESSWSRVLKDSPNEIWEPSINAFSTARFWKSFGGSEVKPIAQNNVKRRDMVLLQSQVSDTGDRLGVLRVKPPANVMARSQYQYTGIVRTASFSPGDYCKGWKIVYEVWSIASNQLLCDLAFDVPLDRVAISDYDFDHAYLKYDFRVESAISQNLRTATALGNIVFRVVSAPPLEGDSFTEWERPYICVQQLQLPDHWPVGVLDLYPTHEDELFVRTRVSPSGDMIAIVGPAAGDVYDPERWYVFKDESSKEEMAYRGPKFRKFRQFDRSNPDGKYWVAFHPSHPHLLISQGLLNTSVFVDLKSPTVQQYICMKKLIGKFYFSQDGLLLRDEKGIYPVEHILSADAVQAYRAQQQPSVDTEDKIPSFWSIFRRTRKKPLIDSAFNKQTRPLAQSTGSVLVESNQSGNLSLSVLQDMQSGGDIILHNFCEDGTVQSHTLSRLPDELTAHVEPALLPRREDESNEIVRVVLNRSQQHGYVLNEKQRYPLPAIIERSKKTIPVVEGRVQLRIQDGLSFGCNGFSPVA